MANLPLVGSRADDLIGFRYRLLREQHHIGMNGVEPITTGGGVGKPQGTHPFTVRGMQLQGSLLCVRHGEVAAQVAQFQWDSLGLRPVGFHSVLLSGVLRPPAKVTEGGGFFEVRRHLSQVLHCRREVKQCFTADD